ncbi:MAG TPA: hypothetical protein PKV15_07125 [Syntrophomonadaceae bacterium]|jgi:hypothetical protein|nr:hypothetical protein [Syntrophomonadaceae bacterium]HPF44455.1 hypothetical protein [Syntrophomonadaceae bacterium]
MSLKSVVKRLEQSLKPAFLGEPDIVLINISGHLGKDPEDKNGRGVALYRNETLVEEESAKTSLPAIVVFIGAEATEEGVMQAIEEAKTNEQLYKIGFVSVTVGMNDEQ